MHIQPPAAGSPKRLFAGYRKVLAGVLAAAAALFIAQSNFILPVKTVNGSFFVANYSVTDENFDHPRLRLLRSREKLDEVIRPGHTQLDKLVLLRSWTRRQWEHPLGKFYYPPWDALEILDLARKYGNQGFCAQYAIVLLQAYQAVGRHARYIDLPGHFVVGVWSDDFNKWVVMDPYNDVHYEQSGVPMSGTALCDAYITKNIKDIVKVSSDGSKTRIALEDIAIYRSYSILLRSDHLSKPVELLFNGVLTRLTLNPDHRTYPLVGRDPVAIVDDFLSYKPVSGMLDKTRIYSENKNDFKRDINQTIIYYMKGELLDQAVKVLLLTDDAPNFRSFLISINGAPWQECPQNKLMWKLDSGMNKLSAKVLTRFGWQGRPSSITLYYKPPWLFNLQKNRPPTLKSL